jgi:hypothetical protein
MPGKSQSHTDSVLNVLRGTTLEGISPYVGLLSAAPGAQWRFIRINQTDFDRRQPTRLADLTDA